MARFAALAASCALLVASAAAAPQQPQALDFAGQLGTGLQSLFPPTVYKGKTLKCPERVPFDMPLSCKSKDKDTLCNDCINFMSNTVLPRLPKDMPCDAPTTFFVSCIVPYIPSFALSGGNSAGLGECNKTEVAERVLPNLSCVGDRPDLKKVTESLSTIAFAESGGRSLFINPAQYGIKAPPAAGAAAAAAGGKR